MANEHAILCGGVPEHDLPADQILRLRMWGEHRNVRFLYEDVRGAMWGDVPPAFRDLIDIAVYVYVADQAVARRSPTDRNFGGGWRSRRFFRPPVRTPALGTRGPTPHLLASRLSFPSGDEYHFGFEPLAREEPIQSYFKFIDGDWQGRAEEVVLYSGGLDSTGGV